jgi:hypothetical protein
MSNHQNSPWDVPFPNRLLNDGIDRRQLDRMCRDSRFFY